MSVALCRRLPRGWRCQWEEHHTGPCGGVQTWRHLLGRLLGRRLW